MKIKKLCSSAYLPKNNILSGSSPSMPLLLLLLFVSRSVKANDKAPRNPISFTISNAILN